MNPITLIHHSANRGHQHPPGSIPAVRHCLEQGARIVEIDLSPTADGDYALLHGPNLERETTGSGPIQALTADQVTELHHAWRGETTDVPVALLCDALDLLKDCPHPEELQLDLKPYSPLDMDSLARLVRALQPVKERVRVTTGADWLLRRLRALDPDLPLGFDPLLYIDLHWPGEDVREAPPYHEGAYGYLDEHPLASLRWGPAADYLAARAETLWIMAPPGAVWYLSANLLARALGDGFDWIADLHGRGAEVDAWTLDPDRTGHLALAERLAALGVDRITTNDAPGLAGVLSVPTQF